MTKRRKKKTSGEQQGLVVKQSLPFFTFQMNFQYKQLITFHHLSTDLDFEHVES